VSAAPLLPRRLDTLLCLLLGGPFTNPLETSGLEPPTPACKTPRVSFVCWPNTYPGRGGRHSPTS
jgi:hypothetical protein